MAQTLITPVADFDLANVTYSAPRANTMGGKKVRILNASSPLILGTPLMMCWGASPARKNDATGEAVPNESGAFKYNLNLQFPKPEYQTPETTAFLHKMQEFENKLMDDAVAHSKDWFGKAKSREVIEELFNRVLYYPKDKVTKEHDMTRSPTMKVDLPFWEGKFNFELYDMEQEQIFNPAMSDEVSMEELIPSMSHVACVISCNGIYFVNGKFGVTWRLVQAVVRKPFTQSPARITGACFVPLSETDRKVAAAAAKRELENPLPPTDSDSEDIAGTTIVEDGDAVPVPKPAAKTVAKTVVKPAAVPAAAAAAAASSSSVHVEDSDNEDAKPSEPVVAKPARKVVKKAVKA